MSSQEYDQPSRASFTPSRLPSPDHVSESLALLEQAVGKIQDSDTFRSYLEAQARFYHYSWGNVLLI
jgi:hypothetical protein